MVNKISNCIILFLIFIVISCTKEKPVSYIDGATTIIEPKIVWVSSSKKILSTVTDIYNIRITVKSDGLETPLIKNFPYVDHRGFISGVPRDKSSEIIVEGLDFLGYLLFKGSIVIDKVIGTRMSCDISAEEITPLSPSNFIVEKFSLTSTILKWEDNSYNENYFLIERKLFTALNFDSITTTDANIEIFIDSNLTESTKYIYKLSAFNNAGSSLYSEQDTITTDSAGSNSKPIFITKASDLESIITLGTVYLDTLKALDADSGQVIKYYINTAPINFYLDSLTGAITWNPSNVGDYNIVIRVQDDSSSTSLLEWNVVVLDTSLFVGFEKQNGIIKNGDGFSLDLKLQNGVEVFGFSCEILFNSKILEIKSDSIIRGEYFGTEAISLFHIDGDTISIALTLKSGATTIDGDGILATLNFGTKEIGVDTLKISSKNLNITKSNGKPVLGFGSMFVGKCKVEVE